MYKSILKPLLFQLNPEQAHKLTVTLLNFVLAIPGLRHLFKRYYRFESEAIETEVLGLKFKNPVGLAAGFDKDGKYFKSMAALGFGFIEIGTVTPLPQDGNPKPRLFRLPQDEALINRMGFNNEGLAAMVKRLRNRSSGDTIIGGNIGKNKITPNEKATDDYLKCFNALYDLVDYFVVNVSSPNTPGLRELQEKEPLTQLLQTLLEERKKFSKEKPLLLKIAPDLNENQVDDIIDIATSLKLDGLIIANTTIDRSDLKTSQIRIKEIGNGGLSGKVMKDKSTEIIKYVYQKTRGEIVIVGVGGIHSAEEALEKIDAGASLVQVYTGLVYEGPGLIKKINRAIALRFGN